MTVVESKVHINAPKELIWGLVADLGSVANFNPYVTKSYYTSQALEGVGASRVCEFFNGMKVEETATVWLPGQTVILNIEFLEGMAPPVNGMRGVIEVQDDGKGGSLVIMRGEYQPKYGPLGMLMDRLMVRPQYGNMFKNIAAALKHHAETGELIDGSFLKRAKAAA